MNLAAVAYLDHGNYQDNIVDLIDNAMHALWYTVTFLA